MRKLRKKIELDITPYHLRNQIWRMSLLKFYRTIEYDENIYNEFARKLLDNKIDQKTLDKLDKLRRKHNEQEKQKWEKIKQKRATRLGLSFRNIYRQIKKG